LVEHFHGKEGVTSSSLVPGFIAVAANAASIDSTMAQLLVRDIETDVVRELKIRAARHGRSAEEEHRQILREALRGHGASKSLKELLLEMPDVGEDDDFERPEDLGRPVEL
jgi:antitoxin FitA